MTKEEFPSNSMKSKEEDSEEKIILKITEGELIEKPSGIKRMFRNVFSGENLSGVFTYILEGVLAPSVKNMIYDAGTKGLERAMWGEESPRRPQPGGIVNYSSISTARRYNSSPMTMRMGYSQPIERNSMDIYRLPSRVEAEEVLFNLRMLIDQYGHATVADYYEMIGKTGSYTDNKWGWTSLAHARIERASGGGYYIELPKATPID